MSSLAKVRYFEKVACWRLEEKCRRTEKKKKKKKKETEKKKKKSRVYVQVYDI